MGSPNQYKKNTKLLPVRGMWVPVSCSQKAKLSVPTGGLYHTFTRCMSVCMSKELDLSMTSLKDVKRYLSKVPNVKQVEGLEQLTLFEVKLCLTNSKKCPDILQTQKLRREKGEGCTAYVTHNRHKMVSEGYNA